MDPKRERPKSITTVKQEPFRQHLTDLSSMEKCSEKRKEEKKKSAANNLTRIVQSYSPVQ